MMKSRGNIKQTGRQNKSHKMKNYVLPICRYNNQGKDSQENQKYIEASSCQRRIADKADDCGFTSHNSEAVAIFEEVDRDSEFIYQHFNSCQMQAEQT